MWNKPKNTSFFDDLEDWAHSLNDVLEEGRRLRELHANEASGDADYVDTKIATVAEADALIGMMADLEKLIENQAVSTADRMEVLTAFLATRRRSR